MTTYLVRTPTMASLGQYKAASPSQAACKAFNSVRRKNETLSKFIVESQHSRTLKYYEVQTISIEEPTAHEQKFGILMRTVAKKVEPFLSVE